MAVRIAYWARIQIARQLIIDRLSEVPDAEFVVLESVEDVLEALPTLDGLVLADAPVPQAAQVSEALRAPGRRLKWMHFISAGREGFLVTGIPDDVVVTDPEGGVSPTVAEHAMALLLALGRRIPAILEAQARREWTRAVSAGARSLEGQSLALVGYGHIGREIARRARAFGMEVTAVTRRPDAHDGPDALRPLEDLCDVLAVSDAVVVAIALTQDTHHLIGAHELGACKPGAFVVNISRGGVIDQAALREALVSGQIGGAGLDVTDPEPLPADDPLWECPNLILSPHFAGGGSLRSQARLAEGAADRMRELVARTAEVA